jgi:plasmid stabilization system protein ParE
MKVHWTKTAEDHLDAIYAYIAQDSSEYALRVVDRITRRSLSRLQPFLCLAVQYQNMNWNK